MCSTKYFGIKHILQVTLMLMMNVTLTFLIIVCLSPLFTPDSHTLCTIFIEICKNEFQLNLYNLAEFQ